LLVILVVIKIFVHR